MRDPHLDIHCALCNRPVTLLPTDTSSDERGRPVHPWCYVKHLMEKIFSLPRVTSDRASP
jgi:hypothetical protein